MAVQTALPPTRRVPIWSWPIIVIVGIILILLIVLAAYPVPVDPIIDAADYGAGAQDTGSSATGLQRDWPAATGPTEFDPKLANLGYRLFFDPVMSGDNTLACSTCHNPEYGFSDPRPHPVSASGQEGTRHAPSLWNAAFSTSLFWDGRADSLETQVKMVMADPLELDQDGDALVRELQAIPAYDASFSELFDDGVTVDNVAFALAAFERTLVSDGSRFDAYAAGNEDALSGPERRGLALFRSAGTRCFECHSAPNFTDGNFAVTGVTQDGSDTGNGEFAFKTPSLRNIALRGPYFHNGSIQTLEDIVDFYAIEADEFTAAKTDRRVAGFRISEQEKADLVAFLAALTDDTIPEPYWSVDYVDAEGHVLVPSSVPSGIALAAPPDHPDVSGAEAVVSTSPRERPDCAQYGPGPVLTVKAGESIQDAVDCAVSGDTVEVEPGVYHERVVIDQHGITLRGKADEPSACPLKAADGRFPSGADGPNWPVLDGDIDGDGEFDLTDGVIASGNDFKIEFFIVKNYTGNGVLAEGVTNVIMRHIYAEDTGLYGVYPVHSTNVLLECNVVTNVHDAGVYVGQSKDIVMRNNLAYDNVAGMEIENCVNAEAYGNEAWGNTGGLLIFALPNLTSNVSTGMNIHDNYSHDNNRPKADAPPGSLVALVPVGTGMFVMANDDGVFTNNRLENNDSFGIAIVSMYLAFDTDTLAKADVGPLPENNQVYGNTFANNGNSPDPIVAEKGLPGADILWDASGGGNVFDQPGASSFPPFLPNRNAPVIIQRVVSNLWAILSKLL